MTLRPSLVRALTALALALCVFGASSAFGWQDGSDFNSEFEARLEAIAADDADGFFELGFEYYKGSEGVDHIEELDLAIIAFDRAIKADPGHPYAHELANSAREAREKLYLLANPDYMKMLFSVVGGLGLFLLGMKNMSEGIQAIAGDRMRKMINAVTDNRLLAVGVGLTVTTLVQSSSITTVIVVGLVNSALMQLHQAIGVIIGANIGTTITGWILVLKIGKFGLPIAGVAVFAYMFSKKDFWRYLAMGVMGLGLVFFGLELMKNGFKPMKHVPAFEEAFLWFSADSYIGVLKCAAVGCVLTFLVQSSSATLGITMGLASTGVIPFETAAALVLGENVGTTITAWLASIGTTTVAKRAAYAHVAFNLIGVAWITALFSVYLPLIAQVVEWQTGADPRTLDPNSAGFTSVILLAIATVHTGFNVTNTLIFIPFLRPFARLLERFVPDRGTKEIPHLTSLDIRMVDSPVLAIENSRGEILKMGGGVAKMLDWNRDLIGADVPDKALCEKLFNRERVMDNVQEEVIQFLTELLTSETPHKTAVEARQQLRIADEYESISDYLGLILKARLRLDEENMALSSNEKEEMLELHDRISHYVALISSDFEAGSVKSLPAAEAEGAAITTAVKKLRDQHLESLSETKVDPIKSMSYNAMLNGYRKVKDHALNIAEALTS